MIIFSRLYFFPKVFGEFKEWLILELHEIIRELVAVYYPMNFNLLCGEDSREKC